MNERERKLEAAISVLPRVRLGVRPTPLEPMERLSRELGGPPLYIKRDDLTGLAFGGNKTRMLEFSLADAIRKGAEVVLSGAAVQSNYCRQLAAACAKLGLECRLLVRPVRPVDGEEIQGNQFLQRLFGAKVTVLEAYDRAQQAEAIAAEAARLRAEGRRVYIPREEDTVDLDAIAYAESALEIVKQERELGVSFSSLYLSALDTTQAGIVLGLRALGSPIRVRGFCPLAGVTDRCEEMARMAAQGAKRLGLGLSFAPADFENDDGYVGERYGIPTQKGLEAVRKVAQTEGILLDPVYTGKAMAALIDHVRDGLLPKGEPVLFLHTGGAPALFGYVRDVLPVLEADGT